MRIAVGQIDSLLGGFKKNADKIYSFVEEAVQKKADLIIFPECALFGYHPFDLLERREFVREQEKILSSLAKKLNPNILVIIGFIETNPAKKGRPYFNSMALVHKKK